MQVPAVLVLGRRESNETADVVFDAGYTPVLRESIMSAIAALRRGRFRAIVVDCEHTAVDVLEFVLNVRDVDADVPIHVLNGGELGASIVEALEARQADIVDAPGLGRKLEQVEVSAVGG